jgi:hypothetical protein
VAEVGQRTLNPGVAPARILSCHTDDEVGDLAHDGRPPRSSSLEGPLESDQLPVPGQDRVRRYESRDFLKSTSADRFTLGGEPTALRIREREALATELFLENSVLLSQVFNDSLLVLVDPAGHGGHEQLPRLENYRHPEIVAKSKIDQ